MTVMAKDPVGEGKGIVIAQHDLLDEAGRLVFSCLTRSVFAAVRPSSQAFAAAGAALSAAWAAAHGQRDQAVPADQRDQVGVDLRQGAVVAQFDELVGAAARSASLPRRRSTRRSSAARPAVPSGLGGVKVAVLVSNRSRSFSSWTKLIGALALDLEVVAELDAVLGVLGGLAVRRRRTACRRPSRRRTRRRGRCTAPSAGRRRRWRTRTDSGGCRPGRRRRSRRCRRRLTNRFSPAFRPITASGSFSSPTKMIGPVTAASGNSPTVSGMAWPALAKPNGPSMRLTPSLACSSVASGSGLRIEQHVAGELARGLIGGRP